MHTFVIASISADGYIAPTALERSTNWTSREDLRFFIDRTRQAGVIVMGVTTFGTLPMQPQPKKINIVYSRSGVERVEKIRDQAGKSYKVVELDEAYVGNLDQSIVYVTSLDPQNLVKKLETLGFPELAVCGGASIYDLFLRSGVVNTLYLTVEPIVFGEGVKLLKSGLTRKMKLKSSKNLSQDSVLLEYGFDTGESMPSARAASEAISQMA